jgi:hypothetical protein
MILLTACFLFFCPPVHHVVHRAPVAAPKTQSCEQIIKGRELWDHQDDWVSQFPIAQQHRALQCLGKLKK